MKSTHEWYSTDVEMKEFEESIVIIPVSGAESKVVLVSRFDYGGKIPGLFKNQIAVERLKYVQCIKSYFFDKNQAKVYETFRKATEIVNEIRRASVKEIKMEMDEEEVKAFKDHGDVKLEERNDSDDEADQDDIPREDSADAGVEIDEASEVQSINDNYLDLTANFMKANPFKADKVKRHTFHAKPSHLEQPLVEIKENPAEQKNKNVEVIYEEVEDDI